MQCYNNGQCAVFVWCPNPMGCPVNGNATQLQYTPAPANSTGSSLVRMHPVRYRTASRPKEALRWLRARQAASMCTSACTQSLCEGHACRLSEIVPAGHSDA